MGPPLERIAYLARSENRVQVLQALRAEARTRQQLREELPVSRTTLARILNEFETYSLIERSGKAYQTTSVADAILDRFVPLLETMEGITSLGDAAQWIPTDDYAIELAHFGDATVRRPV